jgi:hypothetical protein
MFLGNCETPSDKKERNKRISRETGHGGVENFTIFGKKTEGTATV